ncbi:MAG TPA: regulatory iron-sulfur-containing complex subunit RicT [bacterium]|nr:regulatory iron-sulfur-containing complex subunit RicT [bacterium]
MADRRHQHLSFDEQRELEILEKTRNEGFVDEELQKNKKAGAPIAPLGGGEAVYFNYDDPQPTIEEALPLQFQAAGKIFWYYYPENLTLPEEKKINEGDMIVAYSERGIELALVLKRSLDDFKMQSKVDFVKKGIIRKATPDDLKKEESLKEKAKEAWRICEQHNRELSIVMKLRKVKYTLDDSKVIFYFTAPGRVDFRELIKRLASSLRRRIEMRQIGVRDTTKILGGLGPCGMELCCRRYLHSFIPVSVKMAKDQNLSLNPNKISGVCGRLFCCLGYENPVYEEIRKQMPYEETEVHDAITNRRGFVKKVNVLQGTVSVVFPSTETESYEDRLIEKVQFRKNEQNKWVIDPAPPKPEKDKKSEKPSVFGDDLKDYIPPFRPEKALKPGEPEPQKLEPRRDDRDNRNRDRDRRPTDQKKEGQQQKPGEQKSSSNSGGGRDNRDRDRNRNRNNNNNNKPKEGSSGQPQNQQGSQGNRDRDQRRDRRPHRPDRPRQDQNNKPAAAPTDPGKKDGGNNSGNPPASNNNDPN